MRWAIAGAIAALCLLVPDRDYTTWLLGLIMGALVSLYVFVRDDVPAWIERYLHGGLGERRTAKALSSLHSRGYVVRHDLQRGRGNWDHIVVGPGGVFLIDSKVLGGAVGVDGDRVHVIRGTEMLDNYSEPLGRRIRGQAYGLHREISSTTGLRPWVQGIICFWNDFDEGVYENEGAVFVHGSRLAEWIAARPKRLVGADLRAVLGYLGMQSKV